MDQIWNNGNVIRVPQIAENNNSFGLMYNYGYDQFPVLEMKQPSSVQETSQHYYPVFPTLVDHGSTGELMIDDANNFIAHNDPNNNKKKRMSNEQLESLENSFQEDMKLEPERKQKLAKELGLQPRQIAVWFQNRRARWKAKQLERVYDALKKEYDAVSKDKHKLQQEVFALRAILKEQQALNKNNVVQIVSTEISNEETVESTSMNINENVGNRIAASNYEEVLNNVEDDDYTHQVMMTTPYNIWAA